MEGRECRIKELSYPISKRLHTSNDRACHPRNFGENKEQYLK
ncbi:unnamed protein product [Moneuplotes crassus]|uniref:Uncharacterized protein n=1 Tax=Euplotes crassus TaxID=5936 RepID=A0AAD1XTI9_EUPCR|nr:unnamed protein product [Moneuplotes crassus]